MTDGERAAAAGRHADHGGGRNSGRRRKSTKNKREDRYAALDLGTNNCRLLIAAPRGKQLRIVDAFSRIVRLGEGVSRSGVLSEAAMERAISALNICAEKMQRRGVTHSRCIATQACRGAENGAAFLDRVQREAGLTFDIILPEEEARLAVAGCADLLDKKASAGLIFDIGGGSTELSWMRRKESSGSAEIAAWASLPFGVVSLAEKWGGREIDPDRYETIVDDVRASIANIGDPAGMKAVFENDDAHLLGTSGTVTSIAGVHLELDRYRRDRVDGLWLSADDTRAVTEHLRAMSFEERSDVPCIGAERADLVVCGCAILEALLREWTSSRVRVADRGLREGILEDLARKARQDRNRRRRQMKKP
ncbi:MAG: Ppx/GppA phosphatase family protein [Pseudomonadota bacterium]